MRKDLQQSSHNNLTINMVVHLSRFFMFLFKIFWSKNFSVGVRLNRSISSLTTMNKFWLNFFALPLFSYQWYFLHHAMVELYTNFKELSVLGPCGSKQRAWTLPMHISRKDDYTKGEPTKSFAVVIWCFFILSLVCKAQTVPLQVISMKNVRITFHHNRIKK